MMAPPRSSPATALLLLVASGAGNESGYERDPDTGCGGYFRSGEPSFGEVIGFAIEPGRIYTECHLAEEDGVQGMGGVARTADTSM